MFRGSIPALVTPFRDGAVDEDALRAFVEWQIAEGSSALVPCGTTGENPTLSIDEHHHVFGAVADACAGRVPIIAGCGSNDTRVALDHMRHAQATGAQAALVVVPYYNKPSQEGLYRHFASLADGCDLPIMLYNVPSRTVADLLPETVVRLAKIPSIIGIKDATGELGRVSAHRHGAGEGFCQLSGNDDSALAFNAAGGIGCISVTANVAPRLCAALQAATQAGDWAGALAIQDRLWPLHAALFSDVSPGPVKYALARVRGDMPADVRLPLVEPSASSRAKVDSALAHAALL
jgi:4-hydroxy-tetrahydrodipicolinate synthase